MRVQQSALSKGEISPRLYGRSDIAAWATAVKRARNVLILREGGMTMRMGTQFVGPVRDQGNAPRLQPFQFGLEQSYALEMGQAYMRPAALGGFVLEGELAITGITRAAQAVVTVPFHGFAVGDDVFFDGIAGMTEINGNVFRVLSVPSTNTFTINADSAQWGVFTGATGGTLRTAAATPTPAPPVVPAPVEPPAPPTFPGNDVWDDVYGGGYGSPWGNPDGNFVQLV